MRMLMPLVFAVLAASVTAADLESVQAELARDIETARERLGDVEARISEARGALSSRINAAQNRVLTLREQSVAARRAADEETLSLSRIESRLATWEEQSRYQSRLLAGFLDQTGARPLSEAGEFDLQNDLAVFASVLREQQDRLYPVWEEDRVVQPEGQIETAETLTLGPVTFFLQTARGRSGLLERRAAMNSVILGFDGAAHEGLAALAAGEGVITFDPTLSRALLIADDDETLLEHISKGGIWVIPILLFALFATTVAVIKAVWLARLPALTPALAERVEKAMGEGQAAISAVRDKTRGMQAALLDIALSPQGATQRDDRLYACLLEQRNRLERWLGAIAITASVSPLLGLLGTVSGMITTFKLMTLFGAGDPSAVSGGISEALVTTELGLVVAIPALLAHALMSRKVKSYFGQLEGDAVQLSQLPPQGSPS